LNTLSEQSADPPTEWGIAAIAGTLVATSFGFVVVQLDVTIVNVAMPQSGASLGAGVAGLQWIVDAYTLAFAALLLTAGSFGTVSAVGACSALGSYCSGWPRWPAPSRRRSAS
jgi:MFS family permease